MIFCSECGNKNKDTAKFCRVCGASLEFDEFDDLENEEIEEIPKIAAPTKVEEKRLANIKKLLQKFQKKRSFS